MDIEATTETEHSSNFGKGLMPLKGLLNIPNMSFKSMPANLTYSDGENRPLGKRQDSTKDFAWNQS